VDKLVYCNENIFQWLQVLYSTPFYTLYLGFVAIHCHYQFSVYEVLLLKHCKSLSDLLTLNLKSCNPTVLVLQHPNHDGAATP